MKDECFVRGDVPMTKSEVRAIVLSKLEPEQDSIVYDIGAGTGSVSVEAALAAPGGHVYAFERKEEGCRLIRENAEKFSVKNVTVVPGTVPESLLEGLEHHRFPKPDRVFVGGSGGKLEEILDILRKENPSVRIVTDVIALETLSVIADYVKRHQLDAEFVSVQISRSKKLGGYHLMQGMNPVYVVTIDGADRKPGELDGDRDDE